MKNNSKRNSKTFKTTTTAFNTSKEMISKESNTNSSTTYEYVTKGRKTLYNSSLINLESPKKQNPFLKKVKKENKRDDSNYKILIKRIAMQLKKRVNFPKCKIIKIYQPYRTLIMRIAQGIKNTAKNMNYWKKWESDKIQKEKKREELIKSGASLIKKEEIKIQKRREPSFLKTKENEENIKLLMSINDSNINVNFINEFEDFLGKNSIQISKDIKVPKFKRTFNNYLLLNISFWKKYINYISLKYKKDLTFFNIVSIIEFYYLWNTDKKDSDIFQKLIIEKINNLFEPNEINDFLIMHKLKSWDNIFDKYKKCDNNYQEIEVKISKDCECQICQNLIERNVLESSIKVPESTIKSKDSKITDYYNYSLRLRPSKNKTQRPITKKIEDKKIIDFFPSTQYKDNNESEEKERRRKSKSKSKSRSKSKKSRDKSKNDNKKKSSENDKMKQILDLLNLESEK